MAKEVIELRGLTIEIEQSAEDQNRAVVGLVGYLDTYNSNDVEERLKPLAEGNAGELVLDCSRLDYVSSMGISTLLSLRGTLAESGGSLCLAGTKQKVKSIFETLGLTRTFQFSENRFVSAAGGGAGPEERAAGPFPAAFECPHCGTWLKATRAGRFRCKECRAVLHVKTDGSVEVITN